MEKQILSSNRKRKVILFSIYRNFFGKGGDPKVFLNTVKFLKPHLEKNEYKVIICSFNNTPQDLFINENLIKTTGFLHNVRLIFYKRRFPRKKAIYQIFEFIINIFRFFCVIYKYRPTIVYNYGEKTLFLSILTKNYFNYKLVFDMRGDYLDELKKLGSPNWKLYLLQRWLRYSLNKTDTVFYISNSNLNELKLKNCITKYNYYDSEFFYFDEKEFKEIKKQLGLSDKFVFVYTGSSQYYQMLDKTIFLFSEFFKRYNDSFLMILTEFPENDFTQYIEKYDVPLNNYFIKHLEHKDVNSIQMAADMAFLIRDDFPLNHNSFPTKFAEYLASGVPVLTTPHIHAIAPMILNYKLGEIIKIKDHYDEEIGRIYNKFKNNIKIKKRCALLAEKELSWQKKSKDIFSVLNQL